MTQADLHYEKMTKTPVSRLIITLGLPSTISMLITNIYNLADTYFVGTLGESPQAATGILFTLQAIIQAFAFMLGHGSGTYVSKALADKNTPEATRYASTAFFTGAVFGTIFMIVGFIFLEPFMSFLGSTPTILPYAKDYGMWVLVSCPFLVCSIVLNNNLRYEGKAFYAMIGLTTGGILNIIGDYFLIVHANLGVYGAGLSTAASQFISFLLLLTLYFKHAQSSISVKAVSRKINVYFNIIKRGFPSLVRQGLSSISNGILNNLIKPYGDAAIAAMSIVNRFSSFVMCVGLGIGQGFEPVCAFNYEAKKYKRVKKSLIFTTLFELALVGTITAVSFIFSDTIIYLFQKSENVIKIGSFALKLACVGLLFLPLSVPVNMLYQSIQRSGMSTFLSLLRSGVILIPTLFVGSYFFDITGIQAAQPLADILTGIISVPFIIYFIKNDHKGSDD